MQRKISILLIFVMLLSFVPVFAENNSVKNIYNNTTETFTFEAEDFINDYDKLKSSDMKVVTDSDASFNRAVYTLKTSVISDIDEEIIINPEVKIEGNYNIFIKTKNAYSQSGIYVSTNNKESQVYYTKPTEKTYEWKYLCGLHLLKGKNKIKFNSYHMGIYIDKIIVTNNIYFMPCKDETLQNKSGLAVYGEIPFPENKKNNHPRLHFSGSDIDKIKENFEHKENINQKNKIIEYSNTVCTGKILPRSYLVDNYVDGKIESNAFLYAIYNERERGREAIDILFNYLDAVHTATSQKSRVLNSAVYTASLVYDWCYDLLSDNEKAEIIRKCADILFITEYGFPFEKASAYSEGHEYEEKILKDTLAFSIAIYDEMPDIYNYVAGRILNEFVPALNYHYNNSSFHNAGDDYGSIRYMYSLFMTELLEKLGVNHNVSINQKDMAYQFVYRLRRDTKRLMGTGDRWTQNNVNPVDTSGLLFLCYNLYKDPYLKNAYYFNDNNLNTENTYNKISPVLHIILNDVNLKPLSVNNLPLSKYMGDEQGVMTARTSWDENSMIVSMKMPEKYFKGHQHLDAGNFEIYYKNPLAIDSGVYNGVNGKFGSDHDLNYNKRTIAHNSVLVYNPDEKNFYMGEINDGGQKSCPDANFYDNTYEKYINNNIIGNIISKSIAKDNSFVYFKGDIKGAYSENKVSELTRSFMFLDFKNKNVPGALIVLDKVVSKNPAFKKSYLLHMVNEPVIADNNIKSSMDKSYINNEVLLPLNYSVNKVEGFKVEGKEYNNEILSSDKKYDESGKWRVEISPTDENNCDYFLNVITVADKGYNINKSNLILSGDYFGTKINDTICFMSKNKEKTDKSFNIEFTADSEKNIIISDLSEGSYTVLDSKNNIVKTSYVNFDTSTLNFKGKGDKYKIIKNNEISFDISFTDDFNNKTNNYDENTKKLEIDLTNKKELKDIYIVTAIKEDEKLVKISLKTERLGLNENKKIIIPVESKKNNNLEIYIWDKYQRPLAYKCIY